jgi:hypothetical protein
VSLSKCRISRTRFQLAASGPFDARRAEEKSQFVF